MSVRALIDEQSKLVNLPACDGQTHESLTTVSAPTLRPRLQRLKQPLRGAAAGAILADKATVTFQVRLAVSPAFGAGVIYPTYANLVGWLSVTQYPITGDSVEDTYPAAWRDVSGLLAGQLGVISVPVDLRGVVQVVLRVGVVGSPNLVPAPLYVTTQVHGNAREIDVVREVAAASQEG